MLKVSKILMIVFTLIGIVYIAIGLAVGLTADPATDEAALKYIFPPIGAAMALAGLMPHGVALRAKRRREYLYGYGKMVRATVERVGQNYSITVNRRHPWVVRARCVHPLTGEDVLLKSHSVWTDVPKEGEQVTIWFDPMNEKRYAFELEEDRQ